MVVALPGLTSFVHAPAVLTGLFSSFLALALHLTYFIRGEHHRHPWRTVTCILLGYCTVRTLLGYVSSLAADRTFLSNIAAASFLITLFTSISSYRIFFHPLKHFPGPKLAKVSKLWHVFSVVRRIDNYRMVDKLHKQYGPVVRIGPNELSVCHPEAVEAVLGARSPCVKAPWYDVGLPLVSLHMTRDRNVHDERRQVWNRAFTAQALKGYEPKIMKHVHNLVARLWSTKNSPVDITRHLTHYSFDVMGDLAFSEDFNQLTADRTHEGVQYLHRGQRPFGFLFPAPWLFLFLSGIPFLAYDFNRFTTWCESLLLRRCNKTLQSPDIMSYLIGHESPTRANHIGTVQQWNEQWAWRAADSRLLVVAGSDTTASTLIFALYELVKNPQHITLLRQELESQGIASLATLATLLHKLSSTSSFPHLNALIHETLRLFFLMICGLLSFTPSSGLNIPNTDIHIPAGVTVGIPSYTLNRSPEIYSHPDKFLPSRWFSKDKDKAGYNDDDTKHTSAASCSSSSSSTFFAPFSLGTYSCVGKQFALMEIRAVIAAIVITFDLEMSEMDDGRGLLEKTEDVFTLALGQFFVKMVARDGDRNGDGAGFGW